MNTDTIRDWFNKLPLRTMEVQEATAIRAQLEIAAQLAELNETLKKISDPTGGIMVGLCATNDAIPVRVKE